MSTEARIYVASLSDYNANRLHGVWINLAECGFDPEIVQEEIVSMLAESTEYPAEDWAIHDTEGFSSVRVSEYNDLERLCGIAELMEKHAPEIIEHALDILAVSADAWEIERWISDHYIGEYDNESDYAYEYIQDTVTIPESLQYYIDYESMARDLEINGNVNFVESGSGKIYVFDGG